MTRSAAFDSLRRVRNEFEAARFALRRCERAWADDPDEVIAATDADVTLDELRRALAHLEVTYVLRLFAEFETVLRNYWTSGLGRKTAPDMRPLMHAVAARRQMSDEDRDAAHQVRELRNDIVHHGIRRARLDVTACVRQLSRFVRWLPVQW